jgi:hypothetical protein
MLILMSMTSSKFLALEMYQMLGLHCNLEHIFICRIHLCIVTLICHWMKENLPPMQYVYTHTYIYKNNHALIQIPNYVCVHTCAYVDNIPYFLAYKTHWPIRRTLIFSLEILEKIMNVF